MSPTATVMNRRRASVIAYLSIAILAILSWGTILLAPQALFWDDWVVVNDDTLRMTRELGLPWIGYVFVGLFALGPWVFKVLVIVATIVVGCTSYEIAGHGLGLSTRERWLIASFIVSLPLFSTRVLADLSTYSWSIAFFFVAWYLLVRKSPSTPGRLRYLVAAVLFFISYTTASLLPFTALPAVHLAYLATSDGTSFRLSISRFIRRFWWLALAPVLFWTVKSIFFQPFGLYENYNQLRLHSDPVSLSAIAFILIFVFVSLALVYLLAAAYHHREPRWRVVVRACLTVVVALIALFIYLTRVSPAPAGTLIAVVLGGCSLVLALSMFANQFWSRRRIEISTTSSQFEVILALGILTLALAMIPYLLVGKLPSFVNWETRHQLLMPVGVAIIIVAALRALGVFAPTPAVRIVAVSLLTLFVLGSLSVSLSLVADWHKQMQVASALRKEPLVRGASTVVFSDLAPSLNFDARTYSFYEYTGWLWTAYGDHSRLGIDRTYVSSFIRGDLDPLNYAASRYGFADYVPSPDAVLVQILPVKNASWLGLLADQTSITLKVTPIHDLSGFH